ncbi:MAG: hypothetical protein WAU86_13715 [Oricola sp.]
MTNLLIRRASRIAHAASAGLILFAVTVPAGAMERFRSDTMPCAAVQQTLIDTGRAIIQYPSTRVDNYMLYDQYVSSSAYCTPDEQAVPATVASADDLTCGVYRCLDDTSNERRYSRETWVN